MFYTGKYFLKYLIKSRHKYGHGIHSPFLFDFIVNVLNDRTKYFEYEELETAINKIKENKNIISTSSYGANASKQKKLHVSAILKKTSVPIKYRKLLFRMVRYYKPNTILELGTCLAVSTLYLSKGNEKSRVISIEAYEEYIKIAKELLENLKINNVQIIHDTFENSLPKILLHPLDFVFFDGNHTYDATIYYFEQCLKLKKSNTIFVFDDIYWSKEMTDAWKYIINNNEVRLSVDLFRFGLVFFNENILNKQHYIIRF